MPKANEKDLRDVPDEVKKQIAFSFVATMDEVLRLALLPTGHDNGTPDERRPPVGAAETAALLPISTELATVNAS
jgi:hypothetical protein